MNNYCTFWCSYIARSEVRPYVQLQAIHGISRLLTEEFRNHRIDHVYQLYETLGNQFLTFYYQGGGVGCRKNSI